VLRDDGTLWLNLGDSYISVNGAQTQGKNGQMATRSVAQVRDRKAVHSTVERPPSVNGLPPKNLVGIPWRVAFALQADGWWLLSDIIWVKPNTKPESVTDRPTKSHEYVFLLTKAARYYYDAKAIAEPAKYRTDPRPFGEAGGNRHDDEGRVYTPRTSVNRGGFNGKTNALPGREAFRAITQTRNARTVWTITKSPCPEAHFATFPPELPRRCILAGSREGDTVLDPFAGAGTTGLVADRLGRNFIGFDLNPKYVEMARRRIAADAPLFSQP
jgi:DNA modification methylase